jgi:hypothetical protein
VLRAPLGGCSNGRLSAPAGKKEDNRRRINSANNRISETGRANVVIDRPEEREQEARPLVRRRRGHGVKPQQDAHSIWEAKSENFDTPLDARPKREQDKQRRAATGRRGTAMQMNAERI